MTDIQQIVSRQVKRWNVERSAFEDERPHPDETGKPRPPATGKPIITISRQRGVRGREVARLLAHELGYGLFDKQIITFIAEHLGVRSELVESLDEQDRSELELWFGNLISHRVFDHDGYLQGLIEVIKTAALQGCVVILGRGANCLLRESPGIHIRLIAPEENRIRTLVEVEGMEEEAARKEIRQVDAERANFVKRYFKANIDDPYGYDLIINMEGATLDAVVKTVACAVREQGWSARAAASK